MQLAIDGLPPGVTATCGRILADKGQDGCIVLEADADAQPGGGQRRRHAARRRTRCRTAQRSISRPSPRPIKKRISRAAAAGTGRSRRTPSRSPSLADIRGITLSTYDITLKPGESQKIEVTIDRSPGFTANVTLDMLMRHLNSTYANTLPPGVTLNDKEAKSLLAGSATQGYLTLTAAKDAPPVEKQQARRRSPTSPSTSS